MWNFTFGLGSAAAVEEEVRTKVLTLGSEAAAFNARSVASIA